MNIFATFPLLANADNIHKYKIEWFSETETLPCSLCDRDPRSILIAITHFDIPTH